MKILVVSGYPAWDKVSTKKMPSHHLFGIHEMVDHYELVDNHLRGILKDDIFDTDSYVDFYQWKSGKTEIIKQILLLIKKSSQYDLIFDQLNRCSIYLGFLKKLKIIKCKLLTIMHHPPYSIQLNVSNSDGYIFFNEEYKELALKANTRKKDLFFVNKWGPDVNWYINNQGNLSDSNHSEVRFIDTGKSRRDRNLLFKAGNDCKIRIDYAGSVDQKEGFVRSYKVDLKDDIGMVRRILKYDVILIPVQENKNNKIGPLGITSYLDGLSLRKPIIASDNVCFAQEIIDNKIGMIYKTGDVEDFKRCLSKLNTQDEIDKYRNNILKYEFDTIEDYSKRLLMILKKI